MDFVLVELLHDTVLVLTTHLAMDEPDREGREYSREYFLHIGCRGDIECLRLLNQWGYPVDLTSSFYFLSDPAIDLVSFFLLHDSRMDRESACRILIEHRDILIPIEGESKRAGNRCCRHVEAMRCYHSWQSGVIFYSISILLSAFCFLYADVLLQCLALLDSESVLLIDDDETKS